MDQHLKYRDQKFINNCSYCGRLHFLYGEEFKKLISSGQLGAICKKCLIEKRKYGHHNIYNTDTDHDAPNSFSPLEILNFDLKSLCSDHSLITQKCLDFFKKNTTFFTNAEIKIKFVNDQTPLILTQIQETIEFRKYLESVVNN